MCLRRSRITAPGLIVAGWGRAPLLDPGCASIIVAGWDQAGKHIVEAMCRNITELRGLEPAATPEEIAAAARQYVRKVSGITRPSATTSEAFEAAVAEVTATTARLLDALPPRRQAPKTVPPLRRPEVVARLARTR